VQKGGSKMKLEIGQKLFLKPVNNRARYGNNEIKEATVSKVGRKYFEVSELSRTKFEIDSLREVSEYVPDWEVYFSKQQILDEDEINKLTSDFRLFFTRFDQPKLSLEQLRKIKEIISE
jgi:hypothetical protein